ncbi:DUF2922 family protein [Candidatus Enterococcus murrayae]|uniref:DUF2922 family protein n=1 Tax=Candidatus Enterococcus murrayae TaxID=2815321 RepID=A0ABS3HMH2_9ENTE|nr:DUF2922 family protein [Enterococcus sp. MJM16]MBO0454656.1 DUF2922 family protein [Enterococcus sp. MJM16]
MTHDLVTTFTNGLGKEHDWTYKNVNVDLPVEQIKEACELLTQLDIFEKNGVKLFDTVVTAKFVTTYETDIFDVENDLKNDAEDSTKEASKEEKMTASSIKLEKSEDTASLIPVKTGRSYDYLYNSSRMALEQALEGPAEARSNHPSLIIKNQTSGLKHTINDNDPSASVSTASVTAQSEETEQLSTRKRFLTWLRRRKNRNKDDPDNHSHDPDTFR